MWGYSSLGWVYKDGLKEYGKAVPEFTKAIELDPSYLNGYIQRAICYENLGKLDEAIKDYEKALELDPDCKEARELLDNLKAIKK